MRKTVFTYDLDKLQFDTIQYFRDVIPEEFRLEKSIKIVNNGMVDIFDFKTYHEEYKLMSQYFTGLTLYLKTALVIDYRYNYIRDNNKNELWRKAFLVNFDAKKLARDKKAYIELFFNIFEPLYILCHFYRHFVADKPESEIEKIYEKYSAVPGTMFNCVYRKYVDKEWKNDDNLWFK